MSRSIATFAAGCFWGVEARFRQLPGVVDVAVGYMGGALDHPTYEDVCSGRTGHAEVAQVEYDDDRISYRELLAVFFSTHDPTTLNRQGPDVGSQYRSAIFAHDEQQRQIAQAVLDELRTGNRFARPVVTELAPAGVFWRAEEYHQRYLEKNGGGLCHV